MQWELFGALITQNQKRGNTMQINIDNMIFEMLATMDNNFQGTTKQRFKQAKKLLLESIAETINDNKQEIIKDFNRRNIIK
jgi:endo-1,4-beta-D-glucanase Y